MPRRNIWLCFVLLTCCDGRTDEEEERPAVKGSHHLSHLGSGLRFQPSASARHGLLTSRYDQRGYLSLTKGEFLAPMRFTRFTCKQDQCLLKIYKQL